MKSLRVVFLVGADTASTVLSVERVCELPGIEPLAILLDTLRPGMRTRMRNLRRNIRREGVSYLGARLAETVRDHLEAWVENIFPRARAREILREAFPQRCFDLSDISKKFGIPVVAAGSLNSGLASEELTSLNADLGIVIGTRVLKRSTFRAPRLGSVNLHKGAVPDYRGMPPGFWELYNGEKSAGVTVHFVDDTLDTGDVVAESRVEIEPLDTPESLLTKLHLEGARTLACAVASLQSGTYRRTPQPAAARRAPYTKPTRRQVDELCSRLPHWRKPSALSSILKNAGVLAIYYFGIFSAVRRRHEKSGDRAAVVLYHRVNDVSKDGVTTGIERFASHMAMLSRWYKPVSSQVMIDQLRAGKPLPATSVAVHFDDCYRDVYLNAFPVMRIAGVPGAAFINSGYIGTSRAFAHDVKRSPFRFENLREDEVRALDSGGFEIGAHTVNHVDLGTCPIEQARAEICGSVRDLEAITGHRISLFSFPFGKESNIRAEVREAVAAAGCTCMFSAFGGTVNSSTDLYDIHRLGASGMHSPLHLAMEIEGISPALLMKRWKQAWRRL